MPVNSKIHGSNEEVDGCNEICCVPRIGDRMVQRIVQVGTRSIPPQNIIIAYRDTGSSDGQVKSIGQVDDSFNNLKMLGSGNTPTF